MHMYMRKMYEKENWKKNDFKILGLLFKYEEKTT